MRFIYLFFLAAFVLIAFFLVASLALYILPIIFFLVVCFFIYSILNDFILNSKERKEDRLEKSTELLIKFRLLDRAAEHYHRQCLKYMDYLVEHAISDSKLYRQYTNEFNQAHSIYDQIKELTEAYDICLKEFKKKNSVDSYDPDALFTIESYGEEINKKINCLISKFPEVIKNY